VNAYSRPLRVSLAAALLGLATPVAAEIPVVELDGVVHAVSADHVVQAIRRADESRAPLLILRLDTPGGLDTAMRQIVDAMLNCRTPVAVWVGPSGARAASAGFVIAIAADVAAMAPGTNIGAAHPVSLAPTDATLLQKATSDTAAYLRSKAARRGRNVEMAEKAVVESRSFTEKEALDLQLIELVVKDVPALVGALEGRELTRFDGSRVTLRLLGQPIVPVRMGWRKAIPAAVARPEILFLLLLGALAGLGAEISHPGALFPGVLGTICLILFLFASQIIPVNWAGVLLILVAIALFAAEVKVVSHGLLAAGGIVALVLGATMLVDSPAPEMRVPLTTLLPAVLVVALGSLALLRLVIRAQRRTATTGTEGLLGRGALAVTDLAPRGFVRIQGEDWIAEAEGGDLRAGEAVVVVAVTGLLMRVRAADGGAAANAEERSGASRADRKGP
jgi:membrane-bound serine protease (ClpP class)